MSDDHNHNDTSGQTGIDQETERRNRENETGQQSQQPPQAGQQQPPKAGQQSDTLTTDQTEASQAEAGQSSDQDGAGFVGSAGDQSSDYLTRGENQDFQPEGQGATDTDAGTSDIETGQSQSPDATLDDGSDTSQ